MYELILYLGYNYVYKDKEKYAIATGKLKIILTFDKIINLAKFIKLKLNNISLRQEKNRFNSTKVIGLSIVTRQYKNIRFCHF